VEKLYSCDDELLLFSRLFMVLPVLAVPGLNANKGLAVDLMGWEIKREDRLRRRYRCVRACMYEGESVSEKVEGEL